MNRHVQITVAQRILGVSILLLAASTILGGPLGVVARGERHLLLVVIAVAAVWQVRTGWTRARAGLIGRHPVLLAPLIFFLGNVLWVFPIGEESYARWLLGLLDAQSLVLLPITVIVLFALIDRLEWALQFGRMVVVLSALLAAAQAAIWVGLRLWPVSAEEIYNGVELVFGTRESVYIVEQPWNEGSYLRIVWISSYWFLVAVFMAPILFRGRVLLLALEAALGLGIVASYTRGIWLGLIVGGAVVMLAIPILARQSLLDSKHVNWRWSLLGVLVALLLAMSFDCAQGKAGLLVSRFYQEQPHGGGQPGVSVEDESMLERIEQTDKLIEMWRQRPILGHGYGAFMANHYSHPERPYLYEMVPFALLMKLGALGFGLYLSSLLFFLYRLCLCVKRNAVSVALLAASTGFLIEVHTNPVFFSFAGMLMFCMLVFFWLWLELSQARMGALATSLDIPASHMERGGAVTSCSRAGARHE